MSTIGWLGLALRVHNHLIYFSSLLRVVSVPRLPRDALVEWQVLAVRKEEAQIAKSPDHENDDDEDSEEEEAHRK